jgi:hypothetical protein
MNETNTNGMPLLGRFNPVLVSAELARILLAIACVEALVSPFAGIKCALCAAATALCSIAVTSQLSSISLSWCWFHLAGLRGQVEQHEEGIHIPAVIQ